MQEENQEKQQNQQNLEKNIDIKATIARFIQEEEPDIPQEEAIMKYEENSSKRKHHYSGDNNDDTDETTEEEEHLKRIKKELLESLRRVEDMAEKLSKEKDEKTVKKMKINSNGGRGTSKGRSQTIIKEAEIQEESYRPKERE